jgi:PIN domain nuclease of toxin-antitoxin system
MKLVLDSSAIIAYFRKEPGGHIVRDILFGPQHELMAHAANLCKVYYDLLADFTEDEVDNALAMMAAFGVTERRDLDTGFWKQAGKHKAAFRRISFADCLCLALAQREKATILTADHDFDPAAQQGLCRVQFIR